MLIKEFGNDAITGRVLHCKEISRMLTTRRIINGYLEREQAMKTDIVGWRQNNRETMMLLDYAEKLVNNGECS